MKTDLATTRPLSMTHTEALVAAFLAGRSRNTIDAYRRDISDFCAWAGAESSEEAAQLLLARGHGEANRLVLDYKAHLVERGLQAATVNRRLASLRSLVRYANTIGRVSWTLDIENLKAQSYRNTAGPGVDGFRRLLREVQGSQPKQIRDRALLHVLYDLGLRRGEAVGVNVEDLELDQAVLWVRSKGQTQKEKLSLPLETVSAISDWLVVRGGDSGALFLNLDRAGKGGGRLTGTSLYRLVRDIGAKVGIRVTPHSLRHTAITEAVKLAQENGYGLEEVRDFSRHRDIKTLMIYRDRERNIQGHIAALVASHV